MAKPGVTYLEVSNAAQQLAASGKVPTIEAIRIALGTGSNSTLGTHLRTWKASQSQTQRVATKENLPEELVATMKGLWELVMNQSEEKIQTIQTTSGTVEICIPTVPRVPVAFNSQKNKSKFIFT